MLKMRKYALGKVAITLCLAMLFTSGNGMIAAAATKQVGDPGVTFDLSKRDPDYPQMAKWQTAGVAGGIPLITSLTPDRTFTSGTNATAINQAIANFPQSGGTIYLKNGTYSINEQINMRSNVRIYGESRDGVICIIEPSMGYNGVDAAFKFEGVMQSGVYRLTIKGGWKVLHPDGVMRDRPKYDWNIGSNTNNELNGNENISLWFKDSSSSWADDVKILNSADFPVRVTGHYNTLRNLHVDGVFNKHGGAHGYFFILGSYNLITGSYVTHLRHISIQGSNAEYNVVYKNNFAQEISFHSGDLGNNLIEQNTITLPADMPNSQPNYYSVMGPWSTMHHISTNKNYVYKNDITENNHGGVKPWSNNSKIYWGPFYVKPADPYTNFKERVSSMVPTGGTLYPVILN